MVSPSSSQAFLPIHQYIVMCCQCQQITLVFLCVLNTCTSLTIYGAPVNHSGYYSCEDFTCIEAFVSCPVAKSIFVKVQHTYHKSVYHIINFCEHDAHTIDTPVLGSLQQVYMLTMYYI